MLRDWQIEDRQRAGLIILERAGARIEKQGSLYKVPSLTKQSVKYLVDPAQSLCTCLDYEMFREPCKHIYAIRFLTQREQDKNAVVLQSPEALRPTYPRPWSIYTEAQTRELHEFLAMAFDICQGIKTPHRGKGRPRNDLSETVFSTLFKVYSTRSGRLFMPQLHEVYDCGYVEKVLHFNRISECLDNPDVTDILKSLIVKTSRPLAAAESVFAPDSTGFAGRKIMPWQDTKYRGKKEHKWTKVHLMVGVNTQIVTDAVIYGPNATDHEQLPEPLYNTAKYFNIREVVADKGYSVVRSHEEITEIGADPYIPYDRDATGGKPSREDVWERAYHYYMLYRAEFLQHYNQRSNVETAIMRIKTKFGNYVRSKSPIAMKNEVFAKIVCHNICTLIQSMYELKIAAGFLADKLKEPV